jgi:hypothetical protein
MTTKKKTTKKHVRDYNAKLVIHGMTEVTPSRRAEILSWLKTRVIPSIEDKKNKYSIVTTFRLMK